MRRRAALAALGVGLVSGCLRLESGGNDTRTTTGTAANRPETATTERPPTTTATETDTEAPATDEPDTDTQTPDDPTYPSGLSDDGISSFLYGTHVRALNETSFQADWSLFHVTDSRTKIRKTYKADSDAALGEWSYVRGGPVEMYRSGRESFWREALGDRYTYGEDRRNVAGKEPSVWGYYIAPFLLAADWGTPTRVNESRPAIWEVTANAVNRPSAVPGWDSGEVSTIASASARVDENGVVRSIEGGYRVRDSSGEKVAYRLNYSISSLGEVTVSEPAWLSTARDQAPTVSATLTDDNQFIRMVVESGSRIEPETRVSVVDDEGGFFHQPWIDEPIEVGVPTFLYKAAGAAESGARAGISRGSRPQSVETETLDGNYLLKAGRQTATYFEVDDI